KNMIKIAIDGMGGDYGPEVVVKGALEALKNFNDLELYLYGDIPKMEKYLTTKERITLIQADSVIAMGETNPIRAIRNQKDASLVMALNSVKEGVTEGIVSAGPTQALVVGGHLIVKKLPEMQRIAIAPIIPSLDKKGKILLDAGANVELKPEHIYELAIFAAIVFQNYFQKQRPLVGLINIGEEKGKGRAQDLASYELLKTSNHFQFYGNVEADKVLTSEADILITDGFTGNVVLKTIEGTAKTMGLILKEEIKSSFFGKIGALFMNKNLTRFKKRFDASEIGGAMIFGLKAPVIKAHGSSNEVAFYNAIRQARTFIKNQVVEKVERVLKEINV
ncbi:MAG: phosphate acyltransferase PlsX, partial [Acholeplasmataceae bacterium]|nr:phosphate acyltransferase PlsX [Acholeplasmataceae bacterium]